MAGKAKRPEMLTRDQIDAVIEHMSAADMIDAMGDGGVPGTKMAGLAFDSAAARAGIVNGTRALELVPAKDFRYLADQLNAYINVESPLPEEPADSPDSASTGG